MFNLLTETLLHEYFSFDAILGKTYDRKRLFSALSDAFCLPQREAEDLFVMTESEAIKEISTIGDYNRYRRMKQYNELVGNGFLFSEEEEALVSIRGSAIRTLEKCNMTVASDSTENSVVKTLTEHAKSGSIIALKTLGVLQCEGIIVEKGLSAGTKNLKKAMKWGDVAAALAMLKYSERDRLDSLKDLNSFVKETPYEFILLIAEDRYGLSAEGECGEETSLIKRASDVGKLDKEKYDPMYARIIFAESIDCKDKKRIVFAEDKSLLSETCDLPLRLCGQNIPIDKNAFADLPFNRPKEQSRVLKGLENGDMRFIDAFRPLCLYSSSDHVLSLYESSVIKSLKSAHIERIEVGGLREPDYLPTGNNVFLRGLKERKNNVYLLVFKGEISDAVIEMTKNILRTDKRRRYALNHPSVFIDLSSVLPICLCDKGNAEKIKDLTDTIELAPIKTNEKRAVIEKIIEETRGFYSVKKVNVSEDVIKLFCEMPVENAKIVLDDIIRENRVKGKALSIDTDMVALGVRYVGAINNTYGFGGAIGENR